MFIVLLVIGILVTGLIYCTIPVILKFTYFKKVDNPTKIKILIINSIIVSIIYTAIMAIKDGNIEPEDIPLIPAFAWFYINKFICGIKKEKYIDRDYVETATNNKDFNKDSSLKKSFLRSLPYFLCAIFGVVCLFLIVEKIS